jgi:hypothetical protein
MGAGHANGFIAPLVVPYKTTCFNCMRKQFFPKKNRRNIQEDKNFAVWMSVPYYYLARSNTIVAKAILDFFILNKSSLIDHFYKEDLKRTKIPKMKNCVCHKK